MKKAGDLRYDVAIIVLATLLLIPSSLAAGGSGGCSCYGPTSECGSNPTCTEDPAYCISENSCDPGNVPQCTILGDSCSCACVSLDCPCEDQDNDGYYEGNCEYFGYTSCVLPYGNDGDCDGDTSDDPSDCPTDPDDCTEGTSTCAICIHPGAEEICDDGVDNDCNGEKDCSDSVCEEDPFCNSIVGECPNECGCYDETHCTVVEEQGYCADPCLNAGDSCGSGSPCYCPSWFTGPACIYDCTDPAEEGQPCAEGLRCAEGACVDASCQYGLADQSCYCDGETISEGEYCCKDGPSSEPCPESYAANYKWYPYEEEADYCGEWSSDCPSPNPFEWKQTFASENNFFYDANYDDFFEVIPLFNNYYYLGEYWPILYDYMLEQGHSDLLSDYSMYLDLYKAYGEPDYYFCPQENGLIDVVPDPHPNSYKSPEYLKDWTDGGGDDLEIYCKDHIIRLCLQHAECPWRNNPDSDADMTCGPQYGGETYPDNKFVRPWQGPPSPDVYYLSIADIVGTGKYNFSFVYCVPGHQGYEFGWTPVLEEGEEFNFDLDEEYSTTLLIEDLLYTLEDSRSQVFCDPDSESDQCTSCKLGAQPLDLGLEHPRSWDETNAECAGDDYIALDYLPEEEPPDEGAEDYRPDFIYQHVDDPDFSQAFCSASPLGENYGLRAWNNVAGCCGDDNGFWYPERKITGEPEEPSQEEMDSGLNNYADCAKTVNQNYLCNIKEEGSQWETAQEQQGDIVHISCYPPGTELVANDSAWFACGDLLSSPNQYSHQFLGQSFSGEQRMSFSDDTKHSYFCQPTENGKESIYECCMGTSCRSDGEAGKTYNTGESFQHTEQNKEYYCTMNTDKQNNQVITTGNIDSTLWTPDLDLTNQQSCEAASLGWTGSAQYHYFEEYNDPSTHQYFCCGEADDMKEQKNGDEKTLYESYNDIEGTGACFNGTFQQNNQYITHNEKQYNETLIENGQIIGCAIDKDNAIGPLQCSGEQGSCDPGESYRSNEYNDPSKPFINNEWMSYLENWPNPGQWESTEEPLIEDNTYCSMANIGDQNYYCSYDETWKQTDEDKSHLSFVEWPTENQKAGCCQPEQCWNGTTCIGSQHDNPMLPPYGTEEEPYRCINGAWEYSDIKYTWDREQSGYCQENSQCLVNPAGEQGNPDNPQCINSGNFIGDHYCEEGDWTTRTKLLALQLLNIPSSNQPYTLYCDSYENTLNKENYNDAESFILYPREMNGTSFNSVNNFCILRYGEDDKVAIATSLNHEIWAGTANFLNIFDQEIASCPSEHEGFQPCDTSPDYIYYNEEINSVVYSKQPLSLGESGKTIWELFGDLFDFIIGQFTEGLMGGQSPYDFIQDTKDFNELYVANQEQVVAVKERVWPTEEHISIRYWGISADVCESVEVYDEKLGEQDYIQCEEDDGKYYVVSSLPEGINVWSRMTSKLRPRKVE